MTTKIPDWDSDLSGHSAVVLDQEDKPICHAAISAYDDNGQFYRTECGKPIQGEEQRPRESFTSPRYEMCLDCWPESIIDE